MSTATFTPTPEQLALRDARRLKKQKAAANIGAASSTSPASFVNLEKGQIIARPWLTVQDNPSNAPHSVRVMTWNVRKFYFQLCGQHRGRHTILCRTNAAVLSS
jgi:hypothetical protein